MKTAINTQSHNEVKDLLNEYVVSPLNTDISTTLSKMSMEIESLEESTKTNINKISPSVNGSISDLKRLLSSHFDDEEDVFENLSNTIEDSQNSISDKIDQSNEELSTTILEIGTVITQLKTDFEKFDNQINDTIKESFEQSEKQSLIEQKYKTLLAVSLSFGIVNALGVIAMIILFLIK